MLDLSLFKITVQHIHNNTAVEPVSDFMALELMRDNCILMGVDIAIASQKETPNPKGCYVYIVVDTERQGAEAIVYIGRGTGNRYRHPTSGRSSSVGLNKMYLGGKSLKVLIVDDAMTLLQSRNVEATLIYLLKPECNIK